MVCCVGVTGWLVARKPEDSRAAVRFDAADMVEPEEPAEPMLIASACCEVASILSLSSPKFRSWGMNADNNREFESKIRTEAFRLTPPPFFPGNTVCSRSPLCIIGTEVRTSNRDSLMLSASSTSTFCSTALIWPGNLGDILGSTCCHTKKKKQTKETPQRSGNQTIKAAMISLQQTFKLATNQVLKSPSCWRQHKAACADDILSTWR